MSNLFGDPESPVVCGRRERAPRHAAKSSVERSPYRRETAMERADRILADRQAQVDRDADRWDVRRADVDDVEDMARFRADLRARHAAAAEPYIATDRPSTLRPIAELRR